MDARLVRRPGSIGDSAPADRPFLAAVLVAGALGLGAPSPVAAQAAEPAAAVEMTNDLKFQPAEITIQAGDTVEWRNTSQVVHTVTADPDEAQDPEHVRLPEGAETFNSGMIEPGGTFRHTFEVPGRYRYFCIPHEMAGMIGEVTVE